jgi:DNA-binding NarL/FixJ family response regulator
MQAGHANKKIRVFLIEDHLIFRQSIAEVLQREKDLEVVGQASNAADGLAAVTAAKPDILMLELRLSGTDGLDLLPKLPEAIPAAKTIVFTNAEADRDVVESMRMGARGYIIKKSPTEEILAGIRRVAAGEIVLQTRHLEMLIRALQTRGRNRALGPTQLSPREKQIIQLVLSGYRNKEIGAELKISEKTVKNHLSNIFDKLGVSDRLELALYVLDKKLLG